MTDSVSLRSFDESLGQAVVELSDLARIADRLQSVVAQLAGHGALAGEHLIGECQLADLLSQRLLGLAIFLTALAAAAPQGATIDVFDAVQDITLWEQARRLSGFAPHEAGAVGAGELALFQD